ncbi:MAG: hypothetical protein SGBAC_007086 [Bacillariaceae sp.]
MLIHTVLACLLLPTRAALASNVYPVTDTNQRYCYDSYHGSSGADSDSAKQEQAQSQTQEQVMTSTRNLDVICSGIGQDASYHGLKQEFQSNKDGTVTDMKTGLMWTEDVYCEGLTYPQVESEVFTFALAGHSDWRIPTIKELFTLSEFNGETGTDIETNIPYIDTYFFNVRYGTASYTDGQVWSSTHYTGAIVGNPNIDCNFGFNSIDGRIECQEQSSTKLYARFVRGNTNIGKNVFSVNDDCPDIIVDTATGLEWARSDSSIALDWDEALDYCIDMELGGYTDWKLPDAHELHSIVDYSRSPDATGSPAIDSLFDSTQIENEAGHVDWGWYWTSTTHLEGVPLGSNAVYIAFGRAMGHLEAHNGTVVGAADLYGAGAQRSDPKEGTTSPKDVGPQGGYRRVYNYARCVRGSSSSAVVA